MEDAAIASDSPAEERLSVVCDIREDMGSEVYVHFDLARGASQRGRSSRPRRRRARGCRDAPRRGAGARRRSRFVARVDRTTGARERGSMELAVDVGRLHFFDPETGLRVDAA